MLVTSQYQDYKKTTSSCPHCKVTCHASILVLFTYQEVWVFVWLFTTANGDIFLFSQYRKYNFHLMVHHHRDNIITVYFVFSIVSTAVTYCADNPDGHHLHTPESFKTDSAQHLKSPTICLSESSYWEHKTGYRHTE